MKNTTLLLIILGAIITGSVFLVLNNDVSAFNNDQNNQTDTSDEVQKITISMKNGNYYPNTVKVKVGIPVIITLDKTVSGCFRSFVIPAFNVRKYSSNPSDIITFIPDRKGTFSFSCSMGMAFGKLIVEE